MDVEAGGPGHPRGGRVFVGLVVMAVGVMLLMDRMGRYDFHLTTRLWPFVLILLGASRLLSGPRHRSRLTSLWLIWIGGWGLLTEFHVFGLDYDTSWPLLVVGVGLLIVGRSFEGPRVRGNRPQRGH